MPRKRKYGYILLTLLVISGLAGTPTVNTLSIKEKKYAADIMKETKSEVVKAVKGLSHAQVNFKSADGRWSIKECVYHIAIAEKNLWATLETSMKVAINPEKRSEIKMTDEQLVTMMEDGSLKVKTFESIKPKNISYKSLDEALNDFKTTRAAHIKYLKATTEDLRNHVVQMSFGWLDCYQLYLLIASHSNQHTQQINEIKTDQRYPK